MNPSPLWCRRQVLNFGRWSLPPFYVLGLLYQFARNYTIGCAALLHFLNELNSKTNKTNFKIASFSNKYYATLKQTTKTGFIICGTIGGGNNLYGFAVTGEESMLEDTKIQFYNHINDVVQVIFANTSDTGFIMAFGDIAQSDINFYMFS